MEKFTFFWKTEDIYSQWHPSVFWINGIEYNCAEQYMMYQKALYFGDEDTAAKIMLTSDPKEQKALGREVKNFKAEQWDKICKKVVYRGNYAKFKQNKKLYESLLSTHGTTLVEASPFDKIWGIGLRESDHRAKSRETWEGKNYLGEILTQLREAFLEKERETSSLFRTSSKTHIHNIVIGVSKFGNVFLIEEPFPDSPEIPELSDIIDDDNFHFSKSEREKFGILKPGAYSCTIELHSFKSNHPQDPEEWDLNVSVLNAKKVEIISKTCPDCHVPTWNGSYCHKCTWSHEPGY